MNRLFDSFYPTKIAEKTNFFPLVEMKETENVIDLKLEVPEMEKQDLDVQVTTDAVVISGERRTETETEEKGRKQSEFRYGKFRRVVPLPTNIENTKVQGEYKDGILHLTLPKAEEEKRKTVKVDLS
ncbi:Hsp20/alpha crystallin family protein [Myxosarcina sp. GI1(2024)]